MMAAEESDRIYNYAMGLAEARVKNADAVEELIGLSEGRAEILRSALDRARAELESAVERPSAGTEDTGPPEAPALLATRLLEEALVAMGAEEPPPGATPGT